MKISARPTIQNGQFGGLSVVNVVAVVFRCQKSRPQPCSNTSPGACCWLHWPCTVVANGRWTPGWWAGGQSDGSAEQARKTYQFASRSGVALIL